MNPVSRVSYDVLNRRKRRAFIRSVLQVTLTVLGLILLFLLSFLVTSYLVSPARHVPDLEEVLDMNDEEAARALSGYSEEHLLEAWGEPWAAHDEYESDLHGPGRYLLYKEEEGLDHIEIYLPADSGTVEFTEVWRVFRGYPVYSSRDLTWGTVTPCPWEEEAALGDLVYINFLTSRPAVLDNLLPKIPVIIYYKGEPTPAEDGKLPRIETVQEMHFYDNTLEPVDIEEVK